MAAARDPRWNENIVLKVGRASSTHSRVVVNYPMILCHLVLSKQPLVRPKITAKWLGCILVITNENCFKQLTLALKVAYKIKKERKQKQHFYFLITESKQNHPYLQANANSWQ